MVQCVGRYYVYCTNCFLLKAIKDVLIKGHRQAFVWMDEWYGK